MSETWRYGEEIIRLMQIDGWNDRPEMGDPIESWTQDILEYIKFLRGEAMLSKILIR